VSDGEAAVVPPAQVRASDRERDEVVARLQTAFGEGRLDDAEFDARMRSALGARTRGELAAFVADLPADTAAPLPVPVPAKGAPKPPTLSLAYKTSLRRTGRWRVPRRFRAVSYKGGGTLIDLRAAELTSHVTTIRAIAYKTRVTVVVPPGLRVELSGIGVSTPEDADPAAARWPSDAPIVHVRGIAYKGLVEVRTMPRSSDTPPDALDAGRP